MSFYWVQFVGPSDIATRVHDGCTVRAKDGDEAVVVATQETGKAVARVDILPYPAYPYLKSDGHPEFCFDPEGCRGRTSCPKSHACSE
jgi:hypothetical protein